MVFPQTPLDVHVEMLLGGTFTQVQASPTGVRGADNIVITRGRADEQQEGSQEPGTCTMSLNNRDGRYSPLNPMGPYYGLIGQNTPVRVSTIGDGTTYTRLPGNYGVDNITTPDNAALHITTSIDIRVDATLDNWLQYQTLAGRWTNGGSASSWILYLRGGGDLVFAWTTTGADSGLWIAHLDPASYLTFASGTRKAVRVTLDTTTGTVTFYTASTISGSWTALTTSYANTPGPSGATSIFAGTEPLTLAESGQGRTLNKSICAGKLNAFQLLNGIAGSAVANPDFTAQSAGTTSFNDAAGRTWTLNGDVEVTNRRYRFHGELSNNPPKQDQSGTDHWTDVEVGGILRRYGQGTEPVASPIRRAVTTSTTIPTIYWPCEDAAGSGSFAVGAGTGTAMLISGSPTLATDTHIGGSAALPTIGNSTWTGTVPTYTAPTSNNNVQVVFALYLNTAPANGSIILRVVCGSTRFDLGYTTASGGGVFTNLYDTSSGSLVGSDNSSTAQETVSTGTAYVIGLQAVQSGSDFTYETDKYTTTSANGSGATVTSRTLGAVKQIIVDPAGALTDTVVGHIALYVASSSAFLIPYPPAAGAYTGSDGETAGNRFVRLCLESGVQPRTVGSPDDSPVMGPQGSDTFINLLQSCVDADGGIMYEPRDVLGIGLVMRSGLMSQATAATLNITSSHHLSAVPDWKFDDQLIRNDVTVTRTGGSFARATQLTGPRSVLTPPNGVGTYPDTPTINYQADSQLLDEASWRLHTGTVNEYRVPVLTVGMHTNEMVADPTLAQQLQTADVGSVLSLTKIPTTVQYDDTRQIIQGITETMSNFEFTLAFNCSPASPYDVVVLDDATFSRLDSADQASVADTTLHASLNTTASSFQVDIAAGGALWTTTDTPFDVVVGGERVTVGAVSGSATPQTFSSVTRSVNGVVKTHSAGDSVVLARPFYLGL